jgi:hypothetical protein
MFTPCLPQHAQNLTRTNRSSGFIRNRYLLNKQMIIDNSCFGLAQDVRFTPFTPFLVIKGMTVDIWDYNPPRCFQKKISGRSKHNGRHLICYAITWPFHVLCEIRGKDDIKVGEIKSKKLAYTVIVPGLSNSLKCSFCGTFFLHSMNEEPAWKLTRKVALTHNSVKNNECDVTYVLKEPRRRSKCVIHKAVTFPITLSTLPSSPSCVSAPRIGLVPPVPH